MSRSEAFRTIIVTSDDAEKCRALAANWPGGSGMFQVALRTIGANEPTHYISTGYIEQSVAAALDDPAAFAEQVGAEPEYITGLRDDMIVSDDHYDIVLADYNLSLTPTPEGE